MNRRLPLSLLTLAALVVALAMVSDTLSLQAQRRGRGTTTTFIDGREAIDGEVIVRYRSEIGAIERERAEFEVDAEEVEPISRHGARRIRSRRLNTRELLQTLQANPDVDFAEPNYVVRLGAVPDDPSFGALWGLLNTGQTIGSGTGIPGVDIGAVAAWNVTTGSQSTVVGVVDTGIDYTHPDLAANIWTAPRDFSVTVGDLVITCAAGSHGFNAITNTCNPFDDHSHGTHVAGTIGAVGNNAVGVTGVNWTASMMGLKFLDASGAGTLAGAIKAIEFAIQAKLALGADANIRILSNSWSGGGFSQALRNQIEATNVHEMLFVAAAGNNGTNNDFLPTYPASYGTDNMVSVAATNNRDELATFSNYGANSVDLGAPGVNILSTVPNSQYDYFSGTSMAAPHVSGAAALLLSACSRSNAQLKVALSASVDPTAALNGRTITGGRLNVEAAVASCATDPAALDITSDENSITVTVHNGPGDPNDWLGLYCPSTNPDKSYTTRRYLNGLTTPPDNGLESATIVFPAPSQGGTCNARLFRANGIKLATSSTVSFPVVPPLVTVTNPNVDAGAPLNVVISNGPANPTDWVGTYRIGAADAPSVTWSYLNGSQVPPTTGIANATISLAAPAVPGTYEVRLFANDRYQKLATSNAVTVLPPPTLTINDVIVTEGNSGSTTATFTVTLSPPEKAKTVTVAYATANGTATAGTDYSATSGSLIFAPEVTTQTITLSIAADTVYEADETFVVALSNATNALAGDMQGVATIINDDVPAIPAIAILTPSVSPGGIIQFAVENGPGQLTDWVGLYPAPAPNSSYLEWMFLNGMKVAPSTGLSNATLQFTAPMTPGIYNIRFFANNGYTVLAVSANITIAAIPALSISDVIVAEGNSGTSVATFLVSLTPPNPAQPVTVHFATANGSAMAPGDYASATGTLTFAPSIGSQIIAVTINGDITHEPDETVVVNLSNAANALIADGVGTATITNDDTAAPPSIAVPTTVVAGATFTASVANGPANPADWLGIYAESSDDRTYFSWFYLNGTQYAPATGSSTATVTFVAPAAPGMYNVRFFANNGYSRIAISAPITVAPKPPPVLTVLTPHVQPGGVIQFSIVDAPANATDWVGLYPSAAGDTGYLDWSFLNGTKWAFTPGQSTATLQFTAPMTPGTYNVRFFANNGYTRLAVSSAITVAP